MTVRNVILAIAIGAASSLQAGVYDNTFSSFANGSTVAAGNLNGWSDSETLSGEAGTISSISVNLDISGGYNGSLYGYLTYDGVIVTLLNRSGVGTTSGGTPFGYGDSGYNVTLTSSAANNIHFYQSVPGYSINGSGQLTGTWQADGSAISPLSSAASFNTSSGAQSLSSFSGLNPNGTWTLYLADVVAGGGSPQVISYGIDVTTVVPEPINVALGIFAGIFVIGSLWHSGMLRKGLVKISC
jgi:hypothetical protein